MLKRLIRFFLTHQVITFSLLLLFVAWGLWTAPFDWAWLRNVPRNPVPVDAIPDIGENQQIVFTEWEGRSPQDVENQITYPLTTYLLGMPGVKTIRSTSMFGFSSIYIIFNDEVDFYWARSRILEKLSALPPDLLPEGVQPALGPDATALGQVFWYTLEGRDDQGRPVGGWSLHELRQVQDYYVRYALNAVEGVAEVASIGGFVQEYHIELNPAALRSYGLSLQSVAEAISRSNRDVGAGTFEVNQVEYLIRGLGYIRRIEDLEESVVAWQDGTPLRLKDVAWVGLGPAPRRGILDKEGSEAVGGVVVVRHGANPMQVIDRIKEKIAQIAPGLPRKQLSDGRTSQLTIVPFYDRSTLIAETLGTLDEALRLEVLISVLVVVVMLNLRASLVVSMLLPVAVLMSFVMMRYAGIDANVVALSGIAIAIGTMVDLGIVLTESITQQLEKASPTLWQAVYKGSSEVAASLLTAVSTTIISFLPVFALEAAEGKLFHPLAYTKTFALAASVVVALMVLPALAYHLLGWRLRLVAGTARQLVFSVFLLLLTCLAWWHGWYALGAILTLACIYAWLQLPLAKRYVPKFFSVWLDRNGGRTIALLAVGYWLTEAWLPLGASHTFLENAAFVALIVGGILLLFALLERYYQRLLHWCLLYKNVFLLIPSGLLLWGLMVWLGFQGLFGWVAHIADFTPWNIRQTTMWRAMLRAFPGIGKEFMPSLDEGSFLLMPTTMPHAGVTFVRESLSLMDRAVASIPEVSLVVGKAGRAESPLDPAPLQMFENIILYKPEYATDYEGRRLRFRTDEQGRFITISGRHISHQEALAERLPAADSLVLDASGSYFRNWRDHIRSPNDIWQEIVERSRLPGFTSSPRLQPIETRLVMLQTGMRAPMGLKIYGNDQHTIEQFAIEVERILKQVPALKPDAVFAERIAAKPYLHLHINRQAAARYGLQVDDIQSLLEMLLGGEALTTIVDGRARYRVRMRYAREFRHTPEAFEQLLVSAPDGRQVLLGELVEVSYDTGPEMIKSEDTFLVGYVLFDRKETYSEVEAVRAAEQALQAAIDRSELVVPAGVSFRFSGNYENQLRAEQRLSVIIPVVLLVIFLILYLQFRDLGLSFMIFTAVAVAFSGGFILLWLWGQDWFANVSLFGQNLRQLFGMQTVYLSVAVWVGFIALFGIATDDGVLMSSYLQHALRQRKPKDVQQLRQAIVEGASRRIRACVMTTTTTIIALLPVLTSTGRGADIMLPMAIPAIGGMLIDVSSYFLLPVLVYWRELRKQKML